MKAKNRYSIDALYQYAHWHSGDEVMAKSLVQDAVISAASFSKQDKGLNHRAVRMVRRDLKYLDRLENTSDWTYRATPGREQPHGALRDLLRQLSFDNRDFMILHLILGYDLRELAEMLNLSGREIRRRMAATKFQLSRAYRQRVQATARREDQAPAALPDTLSGGMGDAHSEIAAAWQ